MSRYLLVVALVVVLLLAAVPALAQGQNYLENPSFEGGYHSYTPRTGQELADCPRGICTTAQIPGGWNPWWAKEWSTDVNPEYKPATQPFSNRIHSGSTAAQYFSFYSTHKAGFYQQANVPANATVQFSVWGQAWVSNADEGGSDRGAPINMRVGIDPTGGTNPYGPSVVWSGIMQPYDAYHQFVVTAQAQGSVVTVFTYSAPSFPMKHNDVYWDDAALVVVGAGAAPPPAQTLPPAATPPPAPPPPPPPAGEDTYVVQRGDTLAGIARRYGVSLFDIAAANNIENINIISVGQVLIIPGVAAPLPPGEESPTGVSAATTVNLRLRGGPSTDYQILATAPRGTTVPALGRNIFGDWIRVTYQGQTGWMAARYLTLSGGTVDSLPVQSP